MIPRVATEQHARLRSRHAVAPDRHQPRESFRRDLAAEMDLERVRRVGVELLRLSHRWRPRAALVPPVRWLLRMEHPVQRAVEILSEAFARRAGSPRARPVGGERADPTI